MPQLSIQYKTERKKKDLPPGLFAQQLVAWYQKNKRDLPWRTTHDPYKIWLSEVILQQTRVAQGLPYYQKFVAQYPTVADLANAPEEEVMRLWQGLGYYTRARNMHACARIVTTQLNGQFPDNYQDLLRLKGIGKYTAAAIASIAYQEPVPVVDGNVYRVLARVFGVEADITSTQGIKVFFELAQSLVPQANVDLYNQAIMEFGALQCVPAKPRCHSCIFKEYCVAFHTAKQHALPVKTKKVKIKQRFFHYLVLQHDNKLYMKRREAKDIWAGLYDFYLIETTQLQEALPAEDTLVASLQRHQAPINLIPKLYKHVLTHQRLYIHFFHVQATDALMAELAPWLRQVGAEAFAVDVTQKLPKPTLINNFLEKEFYS